MANAGGKKKEMQPWLTHQEELKTNERLKIKEWPTFFKITYVCYWWICLYWNNCRKKYR